MKAELVPINGDPPIPIVRDVTVVGRREFCDVQVPLASLSKRHCVLVRTDGLLMVRDLATTNGTKVNGQRVVWAALLPNDRLTIGGYKMRVYLGPDDQPSPSEQYVKKPSGRAAAATPSSRSIGFAAPTPDPNELRYIPPRSLTSGPGSDDATTSAPDRRRQPPPPSDNFEANIFSLDDEDEDAIIDLD